MKNKIYFLLLGSSMMLYLACNQPQPETSSEKNIELAKKSFQAFNDHNWAVQSSYFSDSCQYLDPSYGDKHVVVNRNDKAAKYAAMEKTSPDIKDSITSIFG